MAVSWAERMVVTRVGNKMFARYRRSSVASVTRKQQNSNSNSNHDAAASATAEAMASLEELRNALDRLEFLTDKIAPMPHPPPPQILS